MTRFATAAQTTAALAGDGRGTPLVPGRYEIVEIDGAADRGVAYVRSADGPLVCIDPDDRNITIEEES